ncbi:MAG: DUF1129 domain-containing protein [Candidatus Parvarchaeota archaeon]|nr:DUF1129 domain-containing protein [Candidatus Parvarchaeum tengchongense]
MEPRNIGIIRNLLIWVALWFLVIHIINNGIYSSNQTTFYAGLLFLGEGIISIIVAYRADTLTRKYTQKSKRTKELNPFARRLYKKFGDKTFFITSLSIVAFMMAFYIMYYYIVLLRMLMVNLVLPIFIAVIIGYWINDEIHAHKMEHSS